MNTINPTQIAQTIHNEYDTPVDMDPEYEYETDVDADTGIDTDLDLDQPIVNLDQDYSFLCSFGTLTQEQKNQIEQLASKVNNKDLEFPFDYRRTTDFDSLEDAINYLQGIQYFYKVLFNDFNEPDFKTTNFWLERHHMHPLGLHGKNGGGKDEDDNLVRVPLAVHWLIHALHGDIADLLSDKQLAMHSSQSCQAIYRGVGTEERFYEFFKDVTYVSRQRLYDDVEASRKYWTRERILESALRYNTKSEWRKEEQSAYITALKDKELYQEATAHMTVLRKEWTKEAIITSAKKYNTKGEWKNEEPDAHSAAKRDKQLFDEATAHMTGNKLWTKERILESAKKYKTKNEWCIGDPTPYNKALKDKQLFDEATAHMKEIVKPTGYWTKERILESAKKYKTKNEWKNEEPGAYNAALKDKQLFDEATAHMKDGNQIRADRDRKWTPEAILESAKKYQTKSEWQKAEQSAYNAALNDKQLFNEATAHMYPTLRDTGIKTFDLLLSNPDTTFEDCKEFISSKQNFKLTKQKFQTWIQDQIAKGIREYDPVNNRYVFTKDFTTFESGDLYWYFN